jgi:hypothetical protein
MGFIHALKTTFTMIVLVIRPKIARVVKEISDAFNKCYVYLDKCKFNLKVLFPIIKKNFGIKKGLKILFLRHFGLFLL